MRKVFEPEQTWLECINCGAKFDLLEEKDFCCRECGDLFDIKHDTSKLPGLDELTTRFEERALAGLRQTDDPKVNSGVWRFKEWVLPYLPDEHIVTLGEGRVPIVPAGRHLRDWVGGDIDLYLVLEGQTPTGSFKDLGGTVMMSVAKAAGVQAVACASTGDTSAMAAAYAAAADLQATVILPQGKVTPVQLAQPLVHGATIITLPGDFDDCMRVMRELVSGYGVYPANSLNPARIEGHQASVFLTAQFFGWQLPEWFVVPVGNGSNCSSIGKALRLLQDLGMQAGSRILGCQSAAADPLAASWRKTSNSTDVRAWQGKYEPKQAGETAATAARIGNPVSRDKVMREIIASRGAMQTVSERALNEAVSVCGQDGHFICPQTGTALAGIRNAFQAGTIRPGEKVVAVSTATGLKFTESAARHLQSNVQKASDAKTATVARILGLSA